MAWEQRNGHQYYYRKRREGNRVISEYFGSGLVAEKYAQACQKKKKEYSESRREGEK